MKKICIVTMLAALALVLAPASQASHGDWQEEWHDFGTDLGGLGPSPLDQETGICWYTDSGLIDVANETTPPADPDVRQLNGKTGGAGVAGDEGCHGNDRGTDDPSLAYGTVSGSSSQLGSDCEVGCTVHYLDVTLFIKVGMVSHTQSVIIADPAELLA